jgi:hypothetical protein
MKKLCLLVVVFLSTLIVHADCDGNGFEFFPKQKIISLRSFFIIQGFGFSQLTVKSFAGRNVYLESVTGEKVKLDVVEFIHSGKAVSQAVFKAANALKPNTKYYLRYENITEQERYDLTVLNIDGKSENIFWQTSDYETSSLLLDEINISYKNNELKHYGCGPVARAIFSVIDNNGKNNEVWFRTEVINLSTNVKSTFYQVTEENTLHVGHYMCRGLYKFSDKGKYMVRFTPTNIDGQHLKPTAWIVFDSPYVGDSWFFREE